MNKFDNLLNRISDKDWTWWPVLFARPEKHEKMSNLHVLRATPFSGTMIGLSPVATHMLITGQGIPPTCVIASILTGSVIFFLGFKFSFARSWTRRAAMLNEISGRGLITIRKFKAGGEGDPRNTPMPFPAEPESSGKNVA
jgi:hypothetical protein